MFYQEDIISELITCPQCKQAYNDPRTLPCGEFMCNKCIQSLIKKQKSFKCTSCNTTHKQPANGFVKTSRLNNILKTKPNEVYASQTAMEMKEKLNSIQKLLKPTEQQPYLSRNENDLKDYCHAMRQDLDLKTKNLHTLIDKNHQELNDKINGYENECLKNCVTQNAAHTVFISEIEGFLMEWTNYMKNTKVFKDMDLQQGSLSADERITSLKRKSNESMWHKQGKLMKLMHTDLNSVTLQYRLPKVVFGNIFYADQLKNLNYLNLTANMGNLFESTSNRLR